MFAIVIAVTWAELGGLFPSTSAVVRIPQYVHGYFAGFYVGWAYYLSAVIVPPVELVAIVTYASAYIPQHETIRVLAFITLSILVFQLYPVTALMIVLLALLNDMPIMTIAYDNVRYSPKPERWNMRAFLAISTFLGAVGVVSSFVLLYIGLELLHLSPGILRSFIYLKLSVAGHWPS